MIIPTYNNDRTLKDVIERTLGVWEGEIIVVNDGSTDKTAEILREYEQEERVNVIGYERNRGKGYALMKGMEEARRRGYIGAITIDSDGQHYPEDIHLLAESAEEEERACMVIGVRNLSAKGMPKGNRFANRFGNFWFEVQTWQKVGDTQSGFRYYDLEKLPCRKIISNRYEAELELLVLSAWKGVKLKGVPVRVYYAPQDERVSHFRPVADFMRIFLLNMVLCVAALLYGYPSMILNKLTNRRGRK